MAAAAWAVSERSGGPRQAGAGAQPVLGRIYQRSAVCRQASLGMQEFDPGSVRAAGPATLRFLIGEAGEPTQMAPVDAGRIASIETRQLSANFGGHGRLERSGADVDPGLEIAGAGLQHHTGLMPMGAHGVDDPRIGSIQVHQNVAGVAVDGERGEVNVESLAVASAQEPYRWSHSEQACRPQPFTGAGPSGKAMNGTDQIQFARHRCQLPANGRQGDKKSADHKRGSASQGRIYASTGTAIIKPLTKEKKELSLNGNCVFSLVSHSRGSPHLSAFICVYLRLTFLWDFSPGYKTRDIGRR